MTFTKNSASHRKEPKKKRPLLTSEAVEGYFYKYALHYLERYSSSTENLKRILSRRIPARDIDPDLARPAIEKTVQKLVALNLIDDSIYAESMVRSLLRQGKSPGFIRQKLFQKGLDDDTLTQALATVTEHMADPTLLAAIRFARKKQLGPFARPDREQDPQKDLARFARAGFDYNTARQILEATDADPLLDMLYQHDLL